MITLISRLTYGAYFAILGALTLALALLLPLDDATGSYWMNAVQALPGSAVLVLVVGLPLMRAAEKRP
ncbi:hypothetical protein [Nocardioides sp. KR10-350]|uniref:hypothetical protein n=1 Tax=Nocardioides cheoyonin TaxID=3156615 RepID=UPI0032B551F0